jgi:putative transcriptional regulator
MSELPHFLANQLLVALPSLTDSNFARSVTLLCQHDSNGAMGVVVNQVSDYTLGEVLSQMDIHTDDARLLGRPVFNGGPVHPERGFVIHDDARSWDSSLTVGEGLYLTTSRDILEAMAHGQGPRNMLVALGCAGWGAGQLESELAENSWLTVPVDTGLLFDMPLESRWQRAAESIGVDMFRLTDYSGHA